MGKLKGTLEAIEVIAKRLDARLAAGAALATGSQDAEASFIGTLAKNWDEIAHAFAIQMKGAGVPRKEIWQKTGIDLDNVDGMPRSEIDDSRALAYGLTDQQQAEEYLIGKRSDFIRHKELDAAYPDTQEMPFVLNRHRGDSGGYSRSDDSIEVGFGSNGAKLSPSMHEIQHGIQQREGFATGGSPTSAQQFYWDSLKDQYTDKNGWEIISKSNDLSSEMRPLRDARNILEMRSISQPRQLFNSSFWYEYSDEIRRAIGPPPKSGSQKDYARRAGHFIADKLSNDADYATRHVMNEFGNDKDAIKRRLRNLDKQYSRVIDNGLPEVTKLRREMDRVDPYMANLPLEEKGELYRKLAGEAEARNVQNRLHMTAAERRATPPWETLDVPESEQIVRMRGNATPAALAATAGATGAGMAAYGSDSQGYQMPAYDGIDLAGSDLMQSPYSADPFTAYMQTTLGDFAQRRAQKRGMWDTAKAYAGEVINGPIGQAAGFAMDAAEVPMRGYHGLTALAGNLAAGNSFERSMMRGGQVARQPIDVTARELGDSVYEATGSPAAGALTYGITTMADPIF